MLLLLLERAHDNRYIKLINRSDHIIGFYLLCGLRTVREIKQSSFHQSPVPVTCQISLVASLLVRVVKGREYNTLCSQKNQKKEANYLELRSHRWHKSS